MKDYIFENDALADDKLAICVLIEETDYGDGEYYRQIMGASYSLDCIEKMIAGLKARPETEENAEYHVQRIEQQYEPLFIPDFEIKEPLNDYCYLVYRGPIIEIVDEVIGYFGDRQHATEFAENAVSFFETEDIISIKIPLDRLFEFEETK